MIPGKHKETSALSAAGFLSSVGHQATPEHIFIHSEAEPTSERPPVAGVALKQGYHTAERASQSLPACPRCLPCPLSASRLLSALLWMQHNWLKINQSREHLLVEEQPSVLPSSIPEGLAALPELFVGCGHSLLTTRLSYICPSSSSKYFSTLECLVM